MSTTSNSAQISALVAQLRENKISKAELFASLAAMPRAGTSTAPSIASASSGQPAPSASAVAAPAPPTSISSVDARSSAADSMSAPYEGGGDAAAAPAPAERPTPLGGVATMGASERKAAIEQILAERKAALEARRQRQLDAAAVPPSPTAPAVPESEADVDVDEHVDDEEDDVEGEGYGRSGSFGSGQDGRYRAASEDSGPTAGSAASGSHTLLSVDEFAAQEVASPAGAVAAGHRNRSLMSRQQGHDEEHDERVERSTDGGSQHAGDSGEEGQAQPAQGRFFGGETPNRTSRLHRAASAPRTRERTSSPDYSFQPRIRALPASYGNSARNISEPFEQRVLRWKQRRDELNRQKRKEGEAEKTSECTFKPKINKNSRITARKARGNSGVAVTERLYNHARQRQQRRGVTPKRERNRGARNGSFAEGDSASERPVVPARFEEEGPAPLTLKEKEELETECTFRPKINRSRDATPVRSRYRQTPSNRGAVPTGMDECTFTPRVNPVRKDMGLAQMYVKTEVFDRLSRPRNSDVRRSRSVQRGRPQSARGSRSDGGQQPGAGERPVMDMQTFIHAAESAERGGGSSKRPNSARRSRERSSSAARSVDPERSEAFQAFLARQQATQRRKEMKVEAVRREEEASKGPKLCPGSRKLMANRRRHGTFLSRVKKAALRKEHQQFRQKARESVDPDCTFKPQINESSKRLPKRSFTAMSRGDALRRETAQRLLRLKAEQDELAGLTFQPKTNANPKVTGRLRIREDPENYLKRVAENQRALAAKQRQAVQQAYLEEAEECTFQPQIHEAPAYIKRIAKSMALTKAARPPEKPAREAWR